MLIAALSIGGLGLIFALGLGVASRVFVVEVDPKVEAVLETLPGTNCGACGYAGCPGFAKAVAGGEAEPNGCKAGGHEVACAVGEILGVTVEAKAVEVARIACGFKGEAPARFQYVGPQGCQAVVLMGGGDKLCAYACLGRGDCIRVCHFGAIKLEGHSVRVDETLCTGCGKCVTVCPKGVIRISPKEKKVVVACNSQDKGPAVKKICAIGCIACKLCVKACELEAISVENFLAFINYEKCTGCQACVAKCPTGSIITIG
ncbi:MAG: RnfABCDGE type electron transport complex subunit B [bacterium]